MENLPVHILTRIFDIVLAGSPIDYACLPLVCRRFWWIFAAQEFILSFQCDDQGVPHIHKTLSKCTVEPVYLVLPGQDPADLPLVTTHRLIVYRSNKAGNLEQLNAFYDSVFHLYGVSVPILRILSIAGKSDEDVSDEFIVVPPGENELNTTLPTRFLDHTIFRSKLDEDEFVHLTSLIPHINPPRERLNRVIFDHHYHFTHCTEMAAIPFEWLDTPKPGSAEPRYGLTAPRSLTCGKIKFLQKQQATGTRTRSILASYDMPLLKILDDVHGSIPIEDLARFKHLEHLTFDSFSGVPSLDETTVSHGICFDELVSVRGLYPGCGFTAPKLTDMTMFITGKDWVVSPATASSQYQLPLLESLDLTVERSKFPLNRVLEKFPSEIWSKLEVLKLSLYDRKRPDFGLIFGNKMDKLEYLRVNARYREPKHMAERIQGQTLNAPKLRNLKLLNGDFIVRYLFLNTLNNFQALQRVYISLPHLRNKSGYGPRMQNRIVNVFYQNKWAYPLLKLSNVCVHYDRLNTQSLSLKNMVQETIVKSLLERQLM